MNTFLENNLKDMYPAIAAQWDYEKNGEMIPDIVSPASTKIVWWRCAEGHSWRASIANRVRGAECPQCVADGRKTEGVASDAQINGDEMPSCSGNKVIPGWNDLATVHPSLASEWDYEKNGTLMPTDVTPTSKKVVWWRCAEGHSWCAPIANRVRGAERPQCVADGRKTEGVASDAQINGDEMPSCSGNKVIPGWNDLATVHPSLASEWDHEKNGKLTPNDVTSTSNKIVWWRCAEGHSWYASIANRVRGGECP